MNKNQQLSLYLVIINCLMVLIYFGTTTLLIVRFGWSPWSYLGALLLYSLTRAVMVDDK